MIRNLYHLFPQPELLARLGALTVLQAILEGLLLALLIPVLRALLQPEPDIALASPWLIAGAVGFIIYGVLNMIATPVGFAASGQLAAQLRHRLMRHVTTLPLGWFTDEHRARLARAVTADSGTISHLSVSIGQPALAATFLPATIIAVTFIVDWRMSLVFIAIGLLAFFTLRRAGQIAAESAAKLEKATAKIAGRAIEFGQAQPVLRAAGHATTGTERMRDALANHRSTYRQGLARSTIPDLGFAAVVMSGFIVVLLLGGRLLLDQNASLADTLVILVLAVRFLESIGSQIEYIGALRAMDNAVRRVQSILQTPTLPRAAQPVTTLEHAGIEFDSVSFAYGKTPALLDVSLQCSPGTMTALVGASGSGKTTIIRLIARFFDVHAGSVRVGDVDVRNIDADTLMSEIAIVFQDVYLFDMTIEENLRVARPDASVEEIAEAAKAARLDDVITRLPGGWNTKVGEAGAQLSGGERQRVSIARAFVKKARIVLIDEASSALDPENEWAVSEAIANLASDPNRTVIVIAHRPMTLKRADQVIALQGGRVAEAGLPRELRDADGILARIYKQYEQARGWQIATQPQSPRDSMKCSMKQGRQNAPFPSK